MASKKDKKSGSNAISSGEIVKNKKALFNYELIEKFEAGIVLLGTEVKSLRERSVNMADSYASFKKNGELFIVNMHISPYHFGNRNNHEPLRERKLLMKKRELRRLYGKIKEQGLTLIPVRLYFSRGKVKVELALARGKKLHDKRETLKRKTLDREMERYIKR
ncbi:SsrA-binding protein SmpB [Brachyspira hampsonii]|uniref:SsrA-binding protein n=1 Tax=Brachyspira hampsonii 30446 TaxID=1289135 RepID=A0A2U4F9B7_9SPIR|nr:SsrA-binding protein SmpB [Brachyspira hampsonii]EKV58010.1 SsrA-binding protein [Brachyspira hampsonii 30446]MBW5388837.1 SsrA-binding protein SmpB [Brachyspira hampsonii]MBW5393751.1 SsrA-binding protein SmpB [Brachyspira hampsonii]OEJ16696.1 SsrA-binding protein [Brachyspira hampsonii]PTY41381.1 single-stranded DNA-binding protein [Brachyspira hampsonii bv. II]